MVQFGYSLEGCVERREEETVDCLRRSMPIRKFCFLWEFPIYLTSKS